MAQIYCSTNLTYKQDISSSTLTTTDKTIVGAINELKSGGNSTGKFISLWSCASGMPINPPISSGYEYKVGDSYIVSEVKGEAIYEHSIVASGNTSDSRVYSDLKFKFQNKVGTSYDSMSDVGEALYLAGYRDNVSSTCPASGTCDTIAIVGVCGYNNDTWFTALINNRAESIAEVNTHLYLVDTVTQVGGGYYNYKPSGNTYTEQPSTLVETNEVNINDAYYYNGTEWKLQKNTFNKNTAGIGIVINDDDEIAIDQVSDNIANVTISGTLSNNDFVLSGFSANDYAILPIVMPEISSTDYTVLQIKIKTPATLTGRYHYIIGGISTDRNIVIGLKNTWHLGYWLSSDGENWDILDDAQLGSNTLQPNTDYWIKLEYASGIYEFRISTDGEYFTQDMLANSFESINQSPILLGTAYDSQNPWNGEIDLKECSLKQSSIRSGTITDLWNGTTWTGNVAKATSSLYGLVKPDNATITVDNGIIKVNTVTSITSGSTNSEVPTAKCVYDIVGNIESILASL